MLEQFKKDVKEGLNATPKFLSSKYFYDAIGDDLFVQIMNLPEYYLTRSEFEIFTTKTNEIIDSFEVDTTDSFDLIELGAGDGTKTKELLKGMLEQSLNFSYLPIDISPNALELLSKNLKNDLPGLNIQPWAGDYFKILSSFKNTQRKKVVLFLGSNIGNMDDAQAADFLQQLGSNLNPNDILLLGVDLIKEREVVLPAYNDASGITAKFNLNLLSRINQELGGDFNVEQFSHQPEYTKEEGIAKSFLMSEVDQKVTIGSIGESFEFKKGEKIHTEISRKYNDQILEQIVGNSTFKVSSKITDSKEYFADYILKVQ